MQKWQKRLSYSLMAFCLIVSILSYGENEPQIINCFVDKDGENILIEQIFCGDLKEEKEIFVAAFTERYKNLTLELLGLASEEERNKFMNDAFDDEPKSLSGGKIYFLRARCDEKILGFVSFELEEENTIYIREFAVLPHKWRKGIGAALTKSIFIVVPTVRKVVGITRRLNQDAIDCYIKLGAHFCDYSHPAYQWYDPEKYVGLEYEVPSQS